MTESIWRDLYGILNLTPAATHEEIRAAYRQLVKTMHPDVGGDEDEFTTLTLAHEVLTDPQRRTVYDKTGQYSTGAEDNDGAALLSLIDNLLGKAIAGAEAAGMDPLSCELISGMQMMLTEADQLAAADLTKMQAEWDRYNILLSRFGRLDDQTPNHFTTIFTQKMDALRRRMGVAREALKQHDLCRQYLSGSTYRQPYLMDYGVDHFREPPGMVTTRGA